MIGILPVLLIVDRAFGQGGPPLITDDPGTPGAGKWEVIFALTLEKTGQHWLTEVPVIDINYGLGERIQLKYEISGLIADEPGSGPQGGLSNSLVGFKWRFLDEDRLLPRFRLLHRSVGQKSVVAVRPQMRIEGIDALVRGCLHHDAPAALQRFLEKRRQHPFERLPLQMVEQDLSHLRKLFLKSLFPSHFS